MACSGASLDYDRGPSFPVQAMPSPEGVLMYPRRAATFGPCKEEVTPGQGLSTPQIYRNQRDHQGSEYRRYVI